MVEPPPKQRVGIHVLLFVITVFTTMAAGALQEGADIFSDPRLIYKGLPFSAGLLLILGIHESGHYLASRYWGVRATLPYFIPLPPILSPLGTLGAVIKVRSQIPNRRALIDIGAAGPLAGFLVAAVVSMIGLKQSTVVPVLEEPTVGSIMLGDSMIFSFLIHSIIGSVPKGYTVMLNPVAFAGWIGLFITALNLLPVGQLDGGHIIYALFGYGHRIIARLVVIVLIPMGYLWMGWLVWGILLIFLLGTRHPAPLDPYVPLGPRRRGIGYLSILVFVLCFTPTPFKVTL